MLCNAIQCSKCWKEIEIHFSENLYQIYTCLYFKLNPTFSPNQICIYFFQIIIIFFRLVGVDIIQLQYGWIYCHDFSQCLCGTSIQIAPFVDFNDLSVQCWTLFGLLALFFDLPISDLPNNSKFCYLRKEKQIDKYLVIF